MIRPDWWSRARCGRNGVIGDDPAKRLKVMFSPVAHLVCEGCPVAVECEQSGTSMIGRAYGQWGTQRLEGKVLNERCAVCGSVFKPSAGGNYLCSDVCRRAQDVRNNREAQRRARAS